MNMKPFSALIHRIYSIRKPAFCQENNPGVHSERSTVANSLPAFAWLSDPENGVLGLNGNDIVREIAERPSVEHRRLFVHDPQRRALVSHEAATT